MHIDIPVTGEHLRIDHEDDYKVIIYLGEGDINSVPRAIYIDKECSIIIEPDIITIKS